MMGLINVAAAEVWQHTQICDCQTTLHAIHRFPWQQQMIGALCTARFDRTNLLDSICHPTNLAYSMVRSLGTRPTGWQSAPSVSQSIVPGRAARELCPHLPRSLFSAMRRRQTTRSFAALNNSEAPPVRRYASSKRLEPTRALPCLLALHTSRPPAVKTYVWTETQVPYGIIQRCLEDSAKQCQLPLPHQRGGLWAVCSLHDHCI